MLAEFFMINTREPASTPNLPKIPKIAKYGLVKAFVTRPKGVKSALADCLESAILTTSELSINGISALCTGRLSYSPTPQQPIFFSFK